MHRHGVFMGYLDYAIHDTTLLLLRSIYLSCCFLAVFCTDVAYTMYEVQGIHGILPFVHFIISEQNQRWLQ